MRYKFRNDAIIISKFNGLRNKCAILKFQSVIFSQDFSYFVLIVISLFSQYSGMKYLGVKVIIAIWD